MEVEITSKQMIKPSSSELHLLEPFKLSLLDQLGTSMYSPGILFYAKPSDSNINGSQFLERLKQSLSKALTQFYPAAGRLKNNFFITDFNEGVPYAEARVTGRLSDFIEQTDNVEAMNRLLPCRPFRNIQDPTTPQLAVQVNIFDCGGIALALCFFHKIFDATTVYAFLNSWAAFSRGSNGEIPNPGLLGASSRLFPPIESMPENAAMKSLFFNDGRCKMTRSFVFDANAITTLVLKAKSKSLEHPSRALALSAFLWKHAIQASRSVSGTLKPSILFQPVNIRPKLKPQLPSYSIGNMFGLAISMYDPVGKKDIDLSELAYLLREATESAPNDPQVVLQGFKTMTEQFSHVEEMVSNGDAECYLLSNWLNTLDGNEDFGWGKPTLKSIPGIDSQNREMRNLLYLKNARQHRAIEAWVGLSEKEMGFLERDVEFLAFASPNSYFDKSKI
ncbi:hypothetical protein V6N13_063577 [Hibiscus sabdariffa]|uniref:Uncharacterized protein n=2 Tax=Hibiscus sabdariffa TaxID=183260 RepID=A0ABR2NRE5_9ROSI